MFTNESWEWIKRVGTITSLTGAAIGVGFFFFSQNQRISQLESQMQAATITTSLQNAHRLPVSPDSAPSSNAQAAVVQVNPVLQACADMAKELAARKEPIAALDTTSMAMERIGCSKVPNAK